MNKTKSISFVVAQPYRKNKIFDPDPSPINLDGELLAFSQLKSALKQSGVDIATSDILSPDQADLVMYLEMPEKVLSHRDRSVLLAFECDVIRPDNWKESDHKKFSLMFSLSQHQCPHTRVVSIPIPQRLKSTSQNIPWDQKKFCTMMSGPYVSFHRDELYSHRVQWIRWFTKNAPEDFEFFGSQWERMKLMGPRWIRMWNRLPYWTRIFRPPLKLYKGRAGQKLETLNQYKFSICYENAVHPEYITEKIFDCFFSKNVPIYLGAPDILDWIPKDCFIDARDFKSKDELFKIMKNFTFEQYVQQQRAVEDFLHSKAFERFTNDFFVQTVSYELLKLIKR